MFGPRVAWPRFSPCRLSRSSCPCLSPVPWCPLLLRVQAAALQLGPKFLNVGLGHRLALLGLDRLPQLRLGRCLQGLAEEAGRALLGRLGGSRRLLAGGRVWVGVGCLVLVVYLSHLVPVFRVCH